MKNHILSIFLCLLPLAGAAQQMPAAHKEATEKFISYYNAKDPASFYGMFADVMKEALSKTKTAELFSGLHMQYGKIKTMAPINIAQGMGQYKSLFEKGTLTLTITLDSRGDIIGFYMKPYGGEKTYDERNAENAPSENTTRMSLPFSGECFVFWGGDTVGENYHVIHPAQKNAFDFVRTGADGRSFRTDGRTNEDYHIFGMEITAPCEGTVVMAVDGIPDNKPGATNPLMALGNSVILRTAQDEYVVLAHFKRGSVAVRDGQKVARGEKLGLCGNSGNSTEPHLHFHIQNGPDLVNATGIKCAFGAITANGQPRERYSPVKGDRIANSK
ncbi:peptidoglycan DD-metalloendopeptidase family protein [Alistipes sp. OttesenSCG-928-B03]|nr:peptidoglycan DD-metalloendopeptidase family protein [Alistipes sp. OttesenSCG-928-B03]